MSTVFLMFETTMHSVSDQKVGIRSSSYSFNVCVYQTVHDEIR